MADLARTFEIIFSGDDRVGPVVDAVGRNLSSFSAKVEDMAAPVAEVTDGVLALDAALLTMVLGGLALSINKAGEFGDQFGEIATLIDVPRDALESFSEEILAYSRDSGKSLADINAAIYSAISAGTDYQDSIALLSQTEKLAIAGRADLEATTRLVASTLNAYGEAADQAAHYSDILFTTVKLGQTTIPELSTKLADVTGIAAGSKVPFETLAAAIAAVTATGAPTSQAITSIKAALSNIIKPSSEAEKTAAALGLQFNATGLATKGFDGLLAEVYKTTGGNIEQMGKLFGSVEGLNAAMVLGADSSGKFAGALEAMQGSAGATAIAWAKVKDDFSLVNQQIANNVNATLISLGQRFFDEYGALGGGLIDILKGVGVELDQGTFDPLIKMVEEFGGRLGKLLEGIAQAMPEAFDNVDFSDLLEALGDAGKALGDLFADLDLTEPKDLGRAIQAVVDTMATLVRVTTGIGESFRPFFDAVVEGVKHLNALDEADQKVIGNILGAAKLITELGLGVAASLAAIQASGTDMGRAFDLIFGVIKIEINLLQLAFDGFVGGVGKGLELLLSTANMWSFGQIEGLDQATKDIKEFNAAVGAHALDQIADIGAGWDMVAGHVKETGAAIKAIPATTVATIEAAIDPALQEWAAEANRNLTTTVSVGVNQTEAAQAKQDIAALGSSVPYDPNTGTWTKTLAVAPALDAAQAKAVKDKVDQDFALKTLDLDLQFDLAALEAASATAQAALQFRASVEIADIENTFKTIESLGDGIEAVFESTGDTISTLFSQFANLDLGSATIRGFVEKLYNKENELRAEALKLQRSLTEAQIRYMDSKTAKLNGGEALISVSADGLEPELEAFMWRIVERVQIRAAAEQAEFLLGI
jgi:TP901 family phage tail tape measure protein